jgi:hypothetical protein
MLTGELRSKIDAAWNAFWAGGVAYEDMRWSRLKNQDPATMFATVSEHIFPFLRTMAEADSA